MSVCLVVCDLEISTVRLPRPQLACFATVPRGWGGDSSRLLVSPILHPAFFVSSRSLVLPVLLSYFVFYNEFCSTVKKKNIYIYISKESEKVLMMAFI